MSTTGGAPGLAVTGSTGWLGGLVARGLEESAGWPSESGAVEFFPNCDYVERRSVVSRVSGERLEFTERCRVVDARYLSPSIPAEKPAPFAVADDATVLPVNGLARLELAPSQYVVVGSGKTATDACVWLLSRGVDPDRICWVRPRDPWMLNRAVVQPDPMVYLGMAADLMQLATTATSVEDLFLRLEDAGIMLRIDPSVMPTMAKTPTLAPWELEQLRTLENVVHLGHLLGVSRGRLTFADESVTIATDAVVVHCAADGLKYPPLVPVWRPEAITLQTIRTGFPCFAAALVGYVEATRESDDEKNRLCPPSPLPDSMTGWARMTVLGTRAAMSFSAEADIREWSDRVALNPSRIPPGYAGSGALDDARPGWRRTPARRWRGSWSSRWKREPKPVNGRTSSLRQWGASDRCRCGQAAVDPMGAENPAATYDSAVGSSLTVRAARVEDVARMARVNVRCWQETYRGLMSDAVLDDPDLLAARERFWTTALTDERYRENRAAVAERDGKLIGIAMSGPPLDAAAAWTRQLYALYVYAVDHGSGAGRALLEALIDPAESAALWVADPNPRAQAFYIKHGFVADGTAQVEDGVREIHMVRDVQPGPWEVGVSPRKDE